MDQALRGPTPRTSDQDSAESPSSWLIYRKEQYWKGRGIGTHATVRLEKFAI